MEEENCGWIFVDKVPLLYDKKRVERQLKIETWLDLYQLTRELNIEQSARHSTSAPMSYVS